MRLQWHSCRGHSLFTLFFWFCSRRHHLPLEQCNWFLLELCNIALLWEGITVTADFSCHYRNNVKFPSLHLKISVKNKTKGTIPIKPVIRSQYLENIIVFFRSWKSFVYLYLGVNLSGILRLYSTSDEIMTITLGGKKNVMFLTLMWITNLGCRVLSFAGGKLMKNR